MTGASASAQSAPRGHSSERELHLQDNGPKMIAAINAIYRAASDVAAWPDALRAFAEVFGDLGTLIVYQRADGSLGTIISPGLDGAQADYDRHWCWRDVRMGRAIERGYVESRDAITDRHVVSDEEMASHPFYTEFLAAHGLRWFAGAMISPDPNIAVAVSLQRSADRPPFSDPELSLFGDLARHVENSLRLGIRLINAEVSASSMTDVLTGLGIGVYRIDRAGRVVYANLIGQHLLGSGLRIANGRLEARFEPERAALSSALAAVIDESSEGFAEAPRTVLIRGVDGEQLLAVYVLPTWVPPERPFDGFFLESRATVLVIASPRNAPDPTIVRDLLGLTLGEARVASLVGLGIAPREAAQRLGISEETARTVLKRVFSKTGISRQSELAGLLSRLIQPA